METTVPKKEGGLACSYKNCGNRFNKMEKGKRKFFSFPKAHDMCKEWLQASGREDLLDRDLTHVHKTRRLCFMHFDSSMFMGPAKTRLLSSAVPKHYLPVSLDSTNIILKQPQSSEQPSTSGASSKKIHSSENEIIFPQGDTKDAWLKACKLSNLIPNALLCSAHFKEPDFERSAWRDLQRKWLKKSAIPSRFAVEPSVFCIACGEIPDRNSGIVFHRFRNSKMCKHWKVTCGAHGYEMKHIFKGHSLCSNHFTLDCFSVDVTGRKILRADAVPTIFGEKHEKEISVASEAVASTSCNNIVPLCKEIQSAEVNRFPLRNEDSMEKWMNIVPTKGKIGRYSYVCSEHFLNTDYVSTSNNQVLLNKSAVPSRFSVASSSQKQTDATAAEVSVSETILHKVPVVSYKRKLSPTEREEHLQGNIKILQSSLMRKEDELQNMETAVEMIKQEDMKYYNDQTLPAVDNIKEEEAVSTNEIKCATADVLHIKEETDITVKEEFPATINNVDEEFYRECVETLKCELMSSDSDNSDWRTEEDPLK